MVVIASEADKKEVRKLIMLAHVARNPKKAKRRLSKLFKNKTFMDRMTFTF